MTQEPSKQHRSLTDKVAERGRGRRDLKVYDLGYEVALLSAVAPTIAFVVFLFLNVGFLGYPVWLWLSPLLVYLWAPAVHRLITRDKTVVQLMEKLVRDSKVVALPEAWAKEMVQLYYIGIPSSVLLGYALAQVYPFAFPLGGVIVGLTYFLPWVRAMDLRSSLRREVELELPVVTMLMWGLSEIGYDIMTIIATLKDETDDLKAIPREFAKIYRDFIGFNVRPEEAVLMEIENHPSKLFERVLGGAVTVSSSGGGLSAYFSRMMEEVLVRLKDSWENYGRAVLNLSELTLLFLLLIPLLGVWFALVQGNAAYGVAVVTYFLVPFTGMGLLLYISLQDPLDKVTVKGNTKHGLIGLAVGLALDVVLFLLSVRDAWILVAIPVLGGSLGYGLSVHRTIMRKYDVESHIQILVRAIGEHVRTTGDNLYNTVKKLIGNKAFGKELNEMLRRYLALSASGGEPVPESGSWMGKAIFKILVLADREGVLKYEMIRRLAQFTDLYYEALLTRKRSLTMFLGSALASPVILVVVLALTYYILISISHLVQIPPVQPTPNVPFIPQYWGLVQFLESFEDIGQLFSSMIPGLELAIVEMGVIFGVLLAKGYDGTVRNTFRIFEMVLVSVVANIVLQFVVLRIIG